MKELLRDRVIEALKSVEDPEVGIDIWNLGLIYEVVVNDEGVVKIRMTFTAPACPISKYILFELYSKISLIEGVKDLNVDVVFDPRWTPLNMTPEGRRKFESKYGYDLVDKYLESVKKGRP